MFSYRGISCCTKLGTGTKFPVWERVSTVKTPPPTHKLLSRRKSYDLEGEGFRNLCHYTYITTLLRLRSR